MSTRWIALAALWAISTAGAQGYPSRPVRVIVPHGAGGPIDIPMRGLGQALSQALGQPFIIDNRGGADGIVGAEACARAAPDGYVLCATATNVITIGPGMHTRLPYDPPRDFVPVARIGIADSALVVNASVPASSVKELIALARANPDTITWASFGPNTSSYMYMQWMRKSMGAPFFHVPYKTAIQSQNATVAGEVQVNMYSVGQVLPLVKAGKIKMLAVTGDRESVFAPGVPSFKESGIDLPWRTWYGTFVPTGTPMEIVRRLNLEINKVLAYPPYVEKFLTTQGINPAPQSPEEFAAFLKSDREVFARMMKVIGVRPAD